MVDLSITLPPESTSDKVDVFILFDDTGSFAGRVPAIQALFPAVIADLESSLPGVSFGFGVGRFEDYGGPTIRFGGDVATTRPFILNQPIVTAADAGGTAARDALITAALARTAPGGGGDGPESAVAEGLWQVATGIGFDGNGDGDTSDSGPAGDPTTQTSPGPSGDVPAFSSNTALTSGTVGGVGFRAAAQKLVIVATDVCSIAAFDAATGIPANIIGTGGTEPTSAFACTSTIPGTQRFGFVSDAKTRNANTVSGAVVPSEAGTVQGTVDALNALGIQVLGLATGGGATTSPGPQFVGGNVFLSALARLTGAVDDSGDALVFPITSSASSIADAIGDAVETATTSEIDIEVVTTALPAGLSLTDVTPAVVEDVGPGETAEFKATLMGDGSPIVGGFAFEFRNADSGGFLGDIPATVDCSSDVARCTPDTPLGFTAFDIDAVGDPRGEFAELTYGAADGNVDLAGCDFIAFDPFTEDVTYAVDAVGLIPAGGTHDWANAGGNQPLPLNSFVDTPGGAFALIQGSASVGDDVLEVLAASDVVAAVVYLEDESTFGSVSGGGGATATAAALAEALAALSQAVATDGGPDGALALGVAPNPTTSSAAVTFEVAEATDVRVAVYDALGREVALLVDGPRGPGQHQARLDASALPAGLYVVRALAGVDAQVVRFTVAR